MRPDGEPFGAVPNGAVAVRGDRIAWVGPAAELPPEIGGRPAEVVDGRGGWLTPGLVECHTHLVFGGDRAHEFERRLRGETYEEIARAGGGILSTVAATRAAAPEELLRSACRRAEALAAQGVTTLEIKSGYGLDVETELRMLRVARSVAERVPLRVRTTLLGLHALPPEQAHDREAYVRMVAEELVPAAVEEGLADQADAFCESIAFTARECAEVLRRASDVGLTLRLHADQLSDSGGAALAAELGARSADHLEHATDDGVAAMAEAGTVAVLLPGAYHYLGGGKPPPVEGFRAQGVPMAVGTDLNPGSSPVASPLVAMNLACVRFGLTAEEALLGVTRHAASVLDFGREVGTLEPGKRADLALWDVASPVELAYWLGWNPCRTVVLDGRVVRRVIEARAATRERS